MSSYAVYIYICVCVCSSVQPTQNLPLKCITPTKTQPGFAF